MENILDSKKILLVGGTGSLGNALLKKICSEQYGIPDEVKILSRDETKQYQMQSTITTTNDKWKRDFNLHFIIGDIRNKNTVRYVLKNVDIVLNLAALKHVPPYEFFPDEAIQTNIHGVQNLVNEIVSGKFNIETMCQISTDKACKPVNVYGMTKAIAERVTISGNLSQVDTNFICVRYGNVIESRGSVIPFFKTCIKNDKTIPLTHSDMTRFMMTLEQSCSLIFRALKHQIPGSILIPKLTASKIVDVIDVLRDYYDKPKLKIKTIGIRPGEKIHEVLISEEELSRTRIIDADYVITPLLRNDYYGLQFKDVLKKYEYNKLESANLKEEYSSKICTISKEDLRCLFLKLGVLQ